MAKITLTEEVGTPTVPAAGTISIYAKTDDLMYYLDSAGNEQLITAGSSITQLTGDVTAVGPGSAVATIAADSVTNAKLANAPAYTLKGNNTAGSGNPTDVTSIVLNAPNFPAIGVGSQITGNEATYYQSLLQNVGGSPGASTDFIVANDIGTDSTYYGDFGINASTAVAVGAFDRANSTYLYSKSGDLAIGSFDANPVHFAANNSPTDALTILATNEIATPGLTGYIKGAGTSAVTASATVPVADISGVLPIANGGTNSGAALTNNRAMQSVGGAIVESSVTSTELGYLSGVTSAIQTQLNNKAAAFSVISVAGDVTLTPNAVHLVSSSAARNLTLPAHVAGQRLYIKDATGDCETNNFTLIRTGGGNIDGLAASRTLQTNWGSWQLVDNGTDWFIL